MRKNRQISAFTLIELLTVIAIIGILSGMLMAGVMAARQSAHKARAKAEVRELVKAWKGYWLTYEDWPGSGYNGIKLMDAEAMQHLMGIDDSHNRQGISFIKAPLRAKDDGYEDPWGNLYRVDFAQKSTIEEVEYFQTTVPFPNRVRYTYE